MYVFSIYLSIKFAWITRMFQSLFLGRVLHKVPQYVEIKSGIRTWHAHHVHYVAITVSNHCAYGFPINFQLFSNQGTWLFTILQNFRRVQIQSICRQQNNFDSKSKFLLERVENIVEKGENAGYQHFLLFPQCFQKLSFQEMLKVGICV